MKQDEGIMHIHLNNFNQHKDEFETIFKKPLKVYFDITSNKGLSLGFNILKFECDMGVRDNVSIRNYIMKKYGERAVEIVENLLC